MQLHMWIWSWLRSFLLGEQEWCFESPDPPDVVVKRIKTDVQDLGPMQRVGLFSRGWRDLPQVDGIFGHVTAQRLQLASEHRGPWPTWLALSAIVLVPANLFLACRLLPANFSFDGKIEQRPNGCAVLGICRQEGPARHAVIFFFALGVVVLAFFYARVFLDPGIQLRILGNWGQMDWPLKAVRLFVLAVPILLLWLFCRFIRMDTIFALDQREDLYEFIRRKARPDSPR